MSIYIDRSQVDEGQNANLVLDTTTGITLDQPNLQQMRQERHNRTRATMKAVDAHLAAEVMPKQVDSRSAEERAAISIQALYRGYLGRKKYIVKLYEQFEKEEEMRLEKTRRQVEEGELLVENHRLEVQLDDNNTTRRNKSRQYITHVITIQRAWRGYKRRLLQAASNNNMSPSFSEPEELSETESASGQQPMSVSSPDDSEKNLNPDDDLQSDFDSPTNPEAESQQIVIDAESESVVSDYSEMAAPIKEHLANVQILQKDELAKGATMFPKDYTITQKVVREPGETDEEFSKRLRKINYLSLAQEFAALKKMDADASPFADLHRGAEIDDDLTPTSETSSVSETESDQFLTESALATPCEPDKEFASEFDSKDATDSVNQLSEKLHSLTAKEAWAETPSGGQTEITSKDKNTSKELDSDNNIMKSGPVTIQNKKDLPKNMLLKKAVHDSEEPDSESHEISRRKDSPKRKSGAISPTLDKMGLGDFDVYNMESTLPQMDWTMLEQQLQRAAEEEKQKQQSRKNDREEIRRKLAMEVEEEYYGGERMFKKPNLSTRLQGGMNLQICFMNESVSDQESLNDDLDPEAHTPQGSPKAQTLNEPKQLQPPPKTGVPEKPQVPPSADVKATQDEDFFSKQARLQAEAKLALASVRPMAHMQLEVEKQMRKKSPIAEMVGIPGFGERRNRKLTTQHLYEMNLAQLQVVVNDLHTQIESLNEELVQLLVDRDDLHMEQDSMLVDIEDLTSRRAQELSVKLNNRTSKKAGKRK